MEFHERLYDVRKNAGMTQSDLAEKLGVSRQAVSRWEMGTAKPEFENLIAISDLFGVTTDYLLKGTEHAVPPAASELPAKKKDPNALSIWEKLYWVALCIFLALSFFISIATGDVLNGISIAGLIVFLLAVLICVVVLVVLVVREILTKNEMKK